MSLSLVIDRLVKGIHVGGILVVGIDRLHGLNGLHNGRRQVDRIVRGNFRIFVVPLIFIFHPDFLAIFFAIRNGTWGLDFNLFNNIFGRFLLLLINMRYMLSLSLWGEWDGALGHLQIIIRNFPLL